MYIKNVIHHLSSNLGDRLGPLVILKNPFLKIVRKELPQNLEIGEILGFQGIKMWSEKSGKSQGKTRSIRINSRGKRKRRGKILSEKVSGKYHGNLKIGVLLHPRSLEGIFTTYCGFSSRIPNIINLNLFMERKIKLTNQGSKIYIKK